jgi:6-phosphogluconolactonase
VSKQLRCSGATVWMLILLAAVSGGCGGGMSKSVPPPPPPPPGGSEFLFVTTQNAILGFTVDSTTGMLSNPTETPGPSSSTGIVALPKQGVLYVSDSYVSPSHPNQVDGYAINKSTGALTLLPGSPFTLPTSGGSLGSMAVDPEGKFLFVSNSTNSFGMTDVLAIDNSSGNLTEVYGSPFVDADQSFATVFPSGKYLFSVSDAASAIVAEAIDPNTGTLTPVSGSPFSTMGIAVGCGLYPCSPISLAVNSAGTLFVVAYSGFQFYRAVFPASVDTTTGSLTFMTNGLFQFADSSGQGADFAVAALGNFVYVADIYGIHAINFAPADGTLTEVKGSPFAPGTVNGGFVITADGKFLYAASSSANTIIIFSIDASTGALSPVGNPVAASSGPLMLTLYKP